jgi:hypothetical protein
MTYIQIIRFEKGRMGNDCCLNDVVESKIEHKASCDKQG